VGKSEIQQITADTKVADVVNRWPQTLEVLLGLGFEPLRNPIARRTLARMFSLRQAAAFRGVDLGLLLSKLRAAAGLPAASEPISEAAPACEEAIPTLSGDVRVLGLVPCPLRSILVERFDAFARRFTVERGVRLAWWLAGEGAGAKDVRPWLQALVHRGDVDAVPEVLVAVGTEIFLYRSMAGALLSRGVFGPFPFAREGRPELSHYEDPRGILGLHFVVPFALAVRFSQLPSGTVPRTWADLAAPEMRGHVGFPSLDLPVIPDLLGALHGHLGEERFAAFARNVVATMHPAQAAPRARGHEVPAVVVLPREFSRSAPATGAEEVLPEDGLIGVPTYVAVRAGAPSVAVDVARYFFSDDYLRPLLDHGEFYPNSRTLAPPLPRLVGRPWSPLLEGDPEAETARLRAMFAPGAGS
jgi:hypothetical protein